jgi:hypothetical protein
MMIIGLYYGTQCPLGPTVIDRGRHYLVQNIDHMEAAGYDGGRNQDGLPVVAVARATAAVFDPAAPEVYSPGQCWLADVSSLCFEPSKRPVPADALVLQECMIVARSGRKMVKPVLSVDGVMTSRQAQSLQCIDYRQPVLTLGKPTPGRIWLAENLPEDWDASDAVYVLADTEAAVAHLLGETFAMGDGVTIGCRITAVPAWTINCLPSLESLRQLSPAGAHE